MMRRVFWRLAVRNLRRHLRRTLITLSAVAVGLAGLIFLWGYVDGTNRQMITNITGYLTGHLQVHQRGYHDAPTLDLAFGEPGGIAARVAAATDVAAVAPRIEGEALASGPEKTRGVFVVGIDPGYEEKVTTLPRAIKDGRYLDAADAKGVVIGDRVADVLRLRVGDEVALVTQAADGSVGAARYRVRGIYDSGIDLIDAMYVFLPLPAAQELYALEGRITTLALRLNDIDAVSRTAGALGQQLGTDFEALGWRRLMPGMAADVDFHEMLANIILFVVFVIVTLSIANTVLMGVLDRTHEFGVMMALGTGRGQIARVVLYEAIVLGTVGIGFGIALGLAFVGYFGRVGIDLTEYSKAMELMPGLTGVVYPGIGARQLAWLSALVLVATLGASIYPAIKAAGLTPIEAIQGVRRAVRFRVRLFGGRLHIFPARAVFTRIALRGIARNPRRTLLTFSAIAAGLAAYLFLSALMQGFIVQMRENSTGLLTGHLQIERKGFRDEFDAKLTLADTARLLERVRAKPEVAAAAPRLQAQAMVSSPTRSEPIMIYGVDPEVEPTVTRLHEKVREGSYLSPRAAREIVVGDKLAERLGVRLGEKIVLVAPAADGSLGSAALRVAGIFATDNETLDRSIVVMSLQAARELLAVPRDALTIAVRLNRIEAAEAIAAALAADLTAPDQQAVPWNVLVPEILQMLDLIRVNLRVILIVVFLVVLLGVTNTLLMAVLERTREFGLQLALGTRPAQIVRTVLYESLVLGVFGLCGGTLIGVAIVGYYNVLGFDLSDYAAGAAAIPGMTTVVYPTIEIDNVWLPVLALLVTAVVAALYPAGRAARLDPVQALRHV
ncbi:MAG TPA: ABC transporter permease [Burkholderiales bacterium]